MIGKAGVCVVSAVRVGVEGATCTQVCRRCECMGSFILEGVGLELGGGKPSGAEVVYSRDRRGRGGGGGQLLEVKSQHTLK